jgi:hypothetical protein
MSYGLRVYVLDAEEITRIPGSNDTELLEEVLEARAQEFASYDDEADPFGIDYDPPFSHAQALREIITGKYTRPDCGTYYGWTFDLLCAYLGEWMHKWCNRWSPEWLSELDAAMERGGVGLRFQDGLVESCPVRLPRNPGSIPGIGHWTHNQVLAALPKFEELIKRVREEELLHSLEEEMLPWLQSAAGRLGSMLIGVYG